MTAITEKEHAKRIFDILEKEYPNVKPALEYNSPFELLVATILSAQCTDERVNSVTKKLFKKYRLPKDYLQVTQEELEKDIFSTGFYRQKAKSIRACCSVLNEKFDGIVPNDFDKLTGLPGVGRKTAAVVVAIAFGIPAIAVDTHVRRLSNLLGFINSKNPDKIEERLKELLPKSYWINSTLLLMAHGRKICIAHKPKCPECILANLCPSFNNTSRKK